MDHQLGRIGLINWQSRRNRRLAPGIGLWTLILVGLALVGVIMMGAQAVGWLHLTGPSAWAPAALLLAAISVQVFSVLRAILLWFAG
jgi:hypothetical protein